MEGVRERVICDTECPWKSLQELRKVNNNNNNDNNRTTVTKNTVEPLNNGNLG